MTRVPAVQLDVKAQLANAFAYSDAGKYEQAAFWLRLAADKGDVEAQRWLWVYLAWDLCDSQDVPRQAITWHRTAEEQGFAPAQHSLAPEDKLASEKSLNRKRGRGSSSLQASQA